MSFNILIVDDSNSMRAVIKKIVTMSGFHMDNCYEAGNGKEALAVLADAWVDIIISDINMPEMNGLEMLGALKEHRLFREIPVVIVTTEGSEDRMEEAMASGAKEFIKKPFLPEDLKRALYQVVGMREDGQYGGDEGKAGGVDF